MPPLLNILCLHGGRQTKEIFEHQLNDFRDELRDLACFDFAEGPCELPLITEGDDVHTRSWCSEDGDYAAGDAVVDAAALAKPYDVLLGFSQGGLMVYRYLMRHGVHAATERGLRGIVVGGAPDPTSCFPELTASYAERARLGGGGGSGCHFFGDLPALHVVGEKDSIVAAAESCGFAERCGPPAQVLLHSHAHCIPSLRLVRRTLRSFCIQLSQTGAEAAAAREFRCDELELISGMYEAGAIEEKASGTRVTLPLLSDVEAAVRCPVSPAVVAALGRLQVCFSLSPLYPAEVAEVELCGGPSWHSVEYSQWASKVESGAAKYLREDVGPGTAMIMAGYMYVTEQAQEAVDFLVSIFTHGAASRDGADGGDDDNDDGKTSSEWKWLEQGEEARTALIGVAETAATDILKKQGYGRFNDASAAEGEDGAGDRVSAAAGKGGARTLTIGLIGKPSAGKSTFFNAVTDPAGDDEAARVAAFPFTTIEPNVGECFAPLYCPCAHIYPLRDSGSIPEPPAGFVVPYTEHDEAACDAAYGHVAALGGQRFRRHPVRVKDVAGLVQGAYAGRGKGNRFLNDLCDADVLVHVVDGAGATEADGTACAPGQGSTLEDITWVRAEVHSWIYDNLSAKWRSIVSAPGRLRRMFSGYRSTPVFVDQVLALVGVTEEAALAGAVRRWGPAELHLFVALYVRMRFPMVVALNKSDLPSAAGLAEALRTGFPDEVFVPMSAGVEWDALRLVRRGVVRYSAGASTVAEAAAGASLAKEDAARLAVVLGFFEAAQAADSPLSTTGVQDVLATALALCRAALVFPVRCFKGIPSLKHCFACKPGTTADDVFRTLVYGKLLDGKLVRFEEVEAPGEVEYKGWKEEASKATGSEEKKERRVRAVQVLRRTDVLPLKPVLVRVLSNKRQME